MYHFQKIIRPNCNRKLLFYCCKN